MITEAKGVLFGVGARGLIIKMTVYSRVSDQWVTGLHLFEYGIEDSVVLGNKLYRPFRPHLYETAKEYEYFILDIIRSLIQILVSGILFLLPICKIKKKKMANIPDLIELFIQGFVIVIFLVRLFFFSG